MTTVVLAIALGYLSTAGLSLVFVGHRHAFRIVYTIAGVLSVALGAVALDALVTHPTSDRVWTLAMGIPWLGAHFATDALSAAFLCIIGIAGALTSLYGLGHGAHEHDSARVLPFFTAFLGSMTLVVSAADAFTFLFSWELMSLISWALVVAHHERSENMRAGHVYLIMAGFGSAALLLAIGLLAGVDGHYTFAEIRGAGALRDPLVSGTALLLVMLGTGSKAGLVPLHAWLPLAHPAAPSHVSALLSGVMTKVAVYGFIRFVFDLMGTPAPWWGMLVLAVAACTAFMGVLYALMEHDLKRLLAYHTVENIGIIFIGLGLALAFEAYGLNWAGALAFTAALFHVLNHSLFKSVLFLGAGAVLSTTGERDMERLGGLIHRMPITACTFLVGSAAISALPPLNGFVSEWLTFQAILVSPQLPDWGLKLLVPAAGAVLALSAALAAACFVKAFGITFLGRARSEAAASAIEVDRFRLAAMLALVAFCVLAGVFPSPIIDALRPVTTAFVGGTMPAQMSGDWLTIVPIENSRSSYNGLLLLLLISSSAMLVATLIHRFATPDMRRTPAWDCGFPDSSPATQYTASSFAQPIRRVFATTILRARESVHMPAPGDTGPASFSASIVDRIWQVFYAPVATLIERATLRMNVAQTLSIRQYLAIVFFSLVGLLTVLALWP